MTGVPARPKSHAVVSVAMGCLAWWVGRFFAEFIYDDLRNLKPQAFGLAFPNSLTAKDAKRDSTLSDGLQKAPYSAFRGRSLSLKEKSRVE
jgi:hypothetical protein